MYMVQELWHLQVIYGKSILFYIVPDTKLTMMTKSTVRSPSVQARLATIQTFLILMAMGMWGPPALLREAMIIQNQLALLIRDHGLRTSDISQSQLRWEDWILLEGDCRTKCIAYCFFNLHSIAYDTPPVLRTSEMKINLPHCSDEWRAASLEEWDLARRNNPQNSLSFQSVLSKLFASDQDDIPPISSLGNYVLIHAIIQQIYAVRQASITTSSSTRDGSLPPEDIEKFGRVLRLWQIGWEKAPESSLDPTNPYGPVAFSSTALLRVAYIRLHCDLGPCRGLDTRDPQIIARTLKASPPLTRSPQLSRAILQAAHALSIPVKIGIKFVAHTHTLLWSMQHSLTDLECAFLLSESM
jgi:Fungal specific transcription factor domain